MKRINILIISLLVLISNGFAQGTVDGVLLEISENNTSLLSLQKIVEAEKLGNKTDIYLPNPEMEFHYLWGDPSEMGNRLDFSITQSIDFPSVYSYRNQISDLKNEQTALDYRKQELAIELETRLVCYDLIYLNALKTELSKRLIHARSIATSYRSQFEIGEISILEYNKSQLNLLNVRKEIESNEMERALLLSELSRLNGGLPINFTDSVFQVLNIPMDYEEWYLMAEQNNTSLSWLNKEIEINQKKLSLSKAMTYPKFQAGYMSESVVGEQFQGVIFGLSVPLWENKNKVKFAKANALAFESIIVDHQLQFYNHLKTLHTKIFSLQENVKDYRKSLLSYDHSELLSKALDKGEISLINYMMELTIYYESINNLLDLEREQHILFAELKQYM